MRHLSCFAYLLKKPFFGGGRTVPNQLWRMESRLQFSPSSSQYVSVVPRKPWRVPSVSAASRPVLSEHAKQWDGFQYHRSQNPPHPQDTVIVEAGSVCHHSEDCMLPKSLETNITTWKGRRHLSPLLHSENTVLRAVRFCFKTLPETWFVVT